RLSFVPKSISETIVVTPLFSLKDVLMMAGLSEGMSPPTSPGSKYSSCESFAGSLTSLNVPKKPNSCPFSSDRQRQRYLPPGRTSISHTGIDQPGGPSIQRVTSFGSVCACQTSLRGAWKERVTRTSVSLGSETSALNFSFVIMA